MHFGSRALIAVGMLTATSASAATFNFEFSQPLGSFFEVPGSVLLAEPSSITVSGEPTLVLRRISQGRQPVDPATSFADAKIIVGGQEFPLVYQPFTFPGTILGKLPNYGADPLVDISFGGYDPVVDSGFTYPISSLVSAGLADFGAGGPNLAYDGIGPYTGHSDTLYFALGGTFTNRPDIYSLSAAGVPEADTWALMITGLGLIGLVMRRRTRIHVTYGTTG